LTDAQRFDPTTQFPEFYRNDAIKALGQQRLWTISDPNKRPVDLQNAMRINSSPHLPCPRCGASSCSILHGAQLREAQSQLLTLDELTSMAPGAANAAMHFDWSLDRSVVLDIEPSCPPEVADQLLRLVTGSKAQPEPAALYSEVSMSGRGFHVVLPLPTAFASSGAESRAVMRHPEGWFEVLLYHWITFSRAPIDPARLEAARSDPRGDGMTWDGLFAQLASIVPARAKSADIAGLGALASDAIGCELEPVEEWLVRRLVAEHLGSWTKSLSDEYRGDTSRWEYAKLIWLSGHALELLSGWDFAVRGGPPGSPGFAEPAPDEEFLASLARVVYTAAGEVIPARAKHAGTRSGLPYLLKQAISAITDVLKEHPHQLPGADTEDSSTTISQKDHP